MQNSFASYPEVVIIDGSYELTEKHLSLFVLQNVDGNGQAEIICFWIAPADDLDAFSFFMEKFKERNLKWTAIGVLMVDKHIYEKFENLESKILVKKFPTTAIVLFCLYHTLRSFKQFVKAMNLSTDERDLAVEIFQKMAYAKDEDDYNSILERFKKSVPKCVAEYFDENWHDLRFKWVKGLQNIKVKFVNDENSGLESINRKLKNVILEYSSITLLFKDLMNCVNLLKDKKDQFIASLSLKTPIQSESVTSSIRGYQLYLTPFAFSLVKEEHDSSEPSSNEIVIKQLDPSAAGIPPASGIPPTAGLNSEKQENSTLARVHCHSCTCDFFKSLSLPCRHIFALRQYLKLPGFEESLCAPRWTLQYVKASYRNCLTAKELSLIDKCQSNKSILIPKQSYQSTAEVLTELQKYQKAHGAMLSIAHLMSQQDQAGFDHSMQVLSSFKSCLQAQKKVALRFVPEDENCTSKEKFFCGLY